ncbi:MAG TPA: hypothetical protein VFQ53_12810 [Kofleriaceae bacterium]|nr:hypothetical protein [Kofleriaceae bacterium]
MLDADEAGEVPYASASVRVSPQYFDGGKLVGDGLAKAIGSDETVWDAFLFYPPGARSTADGLPAPEAAIVQTNGVVVGTPNTLPALADQSKLPPALRGKLAVIGSQDRIEQILGDVARRFVQRTRAPR